MGMRRRFSLASVLLLLSGCAVHVRPNRQISPALGAPEAAWTRVLDRFVDDRGRIDFRAIAKEPDDLAAYVAWLADVGPESRPAQFPTHADRLAYYINAYNALAMNAAVHSGRLPQDKVRFFVLTSVELDGRKISLYSLENSVIRPLGEPRIHFALNCMVRGCPRLPREPFSAPTLDQQLEREAKRFLNEDRNVAVDLASGTVSLSSILKWYKGDFLQKASSLVEYVSAYRETPIDPSFDVRFLPYDWTLNQR